jgi:hypothetical protein
MRKVVWAGVAIVAAVCQGLAAAQDTIDRAMVAAITTEGRERSQAATLFYTLTDVLGPRLTASPAHLDAARWAPTASATGAWRTRVSSRLRSAGDGRSSR